MAEARAGAAGRTREVTASARSEGTIRRRVAGTRKDATIADIPRIDRIPVSRIMPAATTNRQPRLVIGQRPVCGPPEVTIQSGCPTLAASQ